MLFNSIHFLLFFVVVISIFFLIKPSYRWVLLLAASIYFYMYFIPVYILILFGIILVDYYAAIFIENSSSPAIKRAWLVGSLIANIGILVIFKYWNFIGENVNGLSGLFKGPELIPALNIILPIGLSFHTFQSMAYTLEVARGNYKAERHLGVYSTYVLFFPQLVAGPIERPQGLLYQLKNVSSKFNSSDFFIGLSQMIYGFFTKVVVADLVAAYVNNVYGNYKSEHGFPVLLAIWLFLIQLYGDFSGYSNIAIGAARIMGYRLETNFKTPLFSKTVSELWRRWHISLSSWFRDYTFQPLAVNYRNWLKWGVVLASVITFLLSGIWHGASWNFVIFGLFSGVAIALEILLKINSKQLNKTMVKKVAGIFYTFNLFAFSAVFFRSATFEQATHFIGSVFSTDFFNFKTYDNNIFLSLVAVVLLFGLFEFFVFRKYTFDEMYVKKGNRLFIMNLLLLLMIFLFGVENGNQFIYFQF
jgi:alginate O-acetyltransferase complex protein AlgI